MFKKAIRNNRKLPQTIKGIKAKNLVKSMVFSARQRQSKQKNRIRNAQVTGSIPATSSKKIPVIAMGVLTKPSGKTDGFVT